MPAEIVIQHIGEQVNENNSSNTGTIEPKNRGLAPATARCKMPQLYQQLGDMKNGPGKPY